MRKDYTGAFALSGSSVYGTMERIFCLGDFVTGIDRSYRRSIYEVIGLHGTDLILAFRSLEKIHTDHKIGYLCIRSAKAMRLATDEELTAEDMSPRTNRCYGYARIRKNIEILVTSPSLPDRLLAARQEVENLKRKGLLQ